MTDEPVFDHLFLSVGAMKAGTTWLYDVLRRHPDVHACVEKEIHYFYARWLNPGLLSDRARMHRAKGYLAFDPDQSDATVLQRRVQWTANWLQGPVDDGWFNGLFVHRGAARWVADFSNLNALLPTEAWRNIAARCRKLRVLYTLREPMDRLWSHVRFHLALQGRSQLLDTWTPDEIFAHIQQGDYLAHTDYVAAISRMRAGLPADALRVDVFDRIRTDPGGFITDIATFLDIAPLPLPEAVMSRVINPSPWRPMPLGLAERLAPFAKAQRDGLLHMGVPLPDGWGQGPPG